MKTHASSPGALIAILCLTALNAGCNGEARSTTTPSGSPGVTAAASTQAAAAAGVTPERIESEKQNAAAAAKANAAGSAELKKYMESGAK
ncbi:MAG: hypothetical protein H7145_18885 [Akkermansiaceae bacterium]|nr:hypothetical protein [Armatimonadota bacterium]